MFSKYARILILSTVSAQELINLDAVKEAVAERPELVELTDSALVGQLFEAEDIKELLHEENSDEDLEEDLSTYSPVVGAEGIQSAFTKNPAPPESGKFFYMSLDRRLGHRAELNSLYTNITVGEGDKAKDYKFEMNFQHRGLFIITDKCKGCSKEEDKDLYPSDSKSGVERADSKKLHLWDEGNNLLVANQPIDFVMKHLHADEFEANKEVTEKVAFNFMKNGFNRKMNITDLKPMRMETLSKFDNPGFDKRNFYAAKYAGYVGLAPPHDAFKDKVPEKTEDFLLNMKKDGAVEHLTFALISDKDQGSIKFGSYDKGAIKKGETLNMIQTQDKEGWFVGASDFRINNRSMENVPQVLRTLIAPEFSFLYMNVNQWHLFWAELRDTTDEDIKFPKLKENSDYLKCKDKNYCWFEEQCDKVIKDNQLEDKFIEIQLQAISGTNKVKGTFDENNGYTDYKFKVYWDDILADSGQFGVDQGFCYITVFPSGIMDTAASKESKVPDEKPSDKKDDKKQDDTKKKQDDTKKKEEKKVLVQADEPLKINADMIIGQRLLSDKYLVFDSRPAEAGYTWNQIGISNLEETFKVGSTVYDASSSGYDKSQAEQDTSVAGPEDSFWAKNKQWLVIVAFVVLIGVVAIVVVSIRKKRQEQTFYSEV